MFFCICFSICSGISGRVAALNMLSKPTEFQSVPFFWTVLLGKSIRYTGKMLIEEKNHCTRMAVTTVI